MKVLNVCIDDWANFMYENMRALRSVGIECDAFKENKHAFDYAEQATVMPLTEIARLVKNYDIVQIFHSCLRSLAIVQHHKVKKIVYHTGSAYRQRPEDMNMLFNEQVDVSMTDHCEFMTLGAKNIFYCATAVDVDSIPKFGHQVQKPYVFGHYPSNPETKGTGDIALMMACIHAPDSYRFDCSTDKVSHKEQLKRINSCDIYIELFKPELNGKPYGVHGVTAFEAAAAGKVVITQNLHELVYLNAYGDHPLLLCEDQNDFGVKIIRMLQSSPKTISLMQNESYNWVKQKHSYVATGNYIKKIISSI